MHPKTPDEIVAVVLLDIAVIVLFARLMGMLARRFRQPAVVGEIIAGILLGPSLLGQFPSNPSVGLFPLVVRPYLNVVAQIGLVIFMFIVGLELDLSLVRGRERIAAVTSISSIALPLGLGIGLATLIHAQHDHVAGKLVHFWPFALFIGASMSITAFPVLARMLTERGMQRTELGVIALACASVDDVLAWSMLAVVIAVVNTSDFVGVARVVGEGIAFVLIMFYVVKPLLRLIGDRYQKVGRLTPNMFAVVIAGFLASSFVTEKIGLHQIFGAFLFGVIMPREKTAGLIREILVRLEQVALLLLLPVFFVVTGLGVNVTSLGPSGPLVLLGVLAVAIVGKFVGATTSSRLMGLSGYKSRAIGVLMNSRGLTELVILNVGVTLKVLDPSLFTIMVLMAVITTIMTEPLLRLAYPEKALQREIAEAERASLGLVDAYRVVAAVGEPGRDSGLVQLGTDIIGEEAPAELVLSRFTETGEPLEFGSGLAVDLAQMTSAMAEMQVLSKMVEDEGVRAVVRAQSTDDVAQSLLAQVEAVECDLLLVPVELQSRVLTGKPADRLVSEAPINVALFLDSSGRGVQRGQAVKVTAGPPGDGDAALEIAIRLALSLGSELRLDPGHDRRHARRLEQLAHTLSAAGVRAIVTQDGAHATEPPSLLPTMGVPLTVIGLASLNDHETSPSELARRLAGETKGPVLVVRAQQGEIGDNLNHLVAHLQQHPREPKTAAEAGPPTEPEPPEEIN